MEKSDSLIVPVKPANKAVQTVAELGEGRSETEGKAELQSTVQTQSRAAVSQAQNRIREVVNRNKKEKLTALLHHVTVDFLRAAFLSLKKRAAAGVDAVTWGQYEERLDDKLLDLHKRLRRGSYRALPTRRTYIPKADGKQRPLGIAAMEDKIVQAAVVMLLTPIYEAEFLGFSYGFRPGRSQHDALDALAYGIKGRYIWWILDADIKSFFDSISHKASIARPRGEQGVRGRLRSLRNDQLADSHVNPRYCLVSSYFGECVRRKEVWAKDAVGVRELNEIVGITPKEVQSRSRRSHTANARNEARVIASE